MKGSANPIGIRHALARYRLHPIFQGAKYVTHDAEVWQRSRKWLAILLPFSVGVLGSAVYSSSAISAEPMGQLLASLYCIPIVVAAIVVGARAALLVAAAAGVAQTLAAAIGHGDPWIQPAAQTLLFVCVALTAARLARWKADASRTDSAEQTPEHPVPAVFHDLAAPDISTLSPMIVGLVRQFRTPLTSIDGAGWVLEDPKLPDQERRELVGIVRKETHRLNRVLMEVLDFSQPRSPRFRTIDLSKIVDDTLQLAGTRDDGRPFTLNKNIPPDLPPLRGDSEQIRQVLLNLITNSIQAMPAGGEIEISARIEDENFIVAVRDRGIGISPASLDRIFEPFYSTHEHRLGLGLPVALRIVTEHGGRMTVDSQQNEGTCISIILPSRPPDHSV